MSNDFTQVSLGDRIIQIQNNRYYNPGSVKANPKGALAQVIVSGLFAFSSTLMIVTPIVTNDTYYALSMNVGLALVMDIILLKSFDMQSVYDSGRFTIDAAGSVIGEYIKNGIDDVSLWLGGENEVGEVLP